MKKLIDKVMEKNLFQYILCFVIAYLLLSIYLYFFVESHIFLPPQNKAPIQNLIKIRTPNKEIVSAIYLPNVQAKYTVLISHGNAEDLAHMLPFLQEFRNQGFSIFAYDYPGYGSSTGKPSEKNTYQAADIAYHYLIEKIQVLPKNVIFYGRSVGAALAIDLAAKYSGAGLIIQSPFLSAIRSVTQFPIFPFDKFNNLEKVKKITCPVLVIHGNYDFVVPFWQGKKIYHEIQSSKLFYEVDTAGHNDLSVVAGDVYWQKIHEFVKML